MAKKQTRRSISVSAAAFARASALAKIRGISLSQLTERALEAAAGKPAEIPADPIPVDGSAHADRELPVEIFEPELGVTTVEPAIGIMTDVIGILIEPDAVPTVGHDFLTICEKPAFQELVASGVRDRISEIVLEDLRLSDPVLMIQSVPEHWPRGIGVRHGSDGSSDDGIHVEYDEQ